MINNILYELSDPLLVRIDLVSRPTYYQIKSGYIKAVFNNATAKFRYIDTVGYRFAKLDVIVYIKTYRKQLPKFKVLVKSIDLIHTLVNPKMNLFSIMMDSKDTIYVSFEPSDVILSTTNMRW